MRSDRKRCHQLVVFVRDCGVCICMNSRIQRRPQYHLTFSQYDTKTAFRSLFHFLHDLSRVLPTDSSFREEYVYGMNSSQSSRFIRINNDMYKFFYPCYCFNVTFDVNISCSPPSARWFCAVFENCARAQLISCWMADAHLAWEYLCIGLMSGWLSLWKHVNRPVTP